MWARRLSGSAGARNKKGGDCSPPWLVPANPSRESRFRILRLGCGFGLGGGLLVAQHGFAAQADLIAFDGQYFHENLIAFLQLVADGADARFGDFAYVQPAVGSGENFDESAEFRDAHYRAEIGLADFGGGRYVPNHLQRFFG